MIKVTPQHLASQGFSSTFSDRFWAKVNKSGLVPAHRPELGPCWVWTAWTGPDGYGCMTKGKKDPIRSHVASWIIHFGEIPKGIYVCHKCDVRNCVRPDHLFLGTREENFDDMRAKGRARPGWVPGEKCGQHKLTELQVREILRIGDSQTQVAIAAKFGVTDGAIHRILKGKNWKHLHTPIQQTEPDLLRVRKAHSPGFGTSPLSPP